MSYLKRHPRREELIEKGMQTTFYGVSVEEMDREDLLMMIGYLGEEKVREAEFRRKERELLGAFNKAR